MSTETSDLSQLVDGLSHITLVASTPDRFYSTVQFYESLGFQAVSIFDRAKPGLIDRNDDICPDSEKETWLHCWGEEDSDDVTIKVRLTNQMDQSDIVHAIKRLDVDWRAHRSAFTLHCKRLPEIQCYLESINHPFQTFPPDVTPHTLHTFDPLGTLIGFAAKHHPFSSHIHAPPKTSTIAQTVSSFAKPTVINATVPTSNLGPVMENGTKKRIGVMTSGGDSPGMNAVVRAVARMAMAKGCEPYAIREGYEGLVQGGNLIEKLSWEDVRGYLSEGGTLIGTARCAAFRERPGRLLAAQHLIEAGIDALIICGGDGSLTGADLFRAEWSSLVKELMEKKLITQEQAEPYKTLSIVGLVGSIDNDMALTDSTIGAYSSLHRICESVDSISATASSHSRAFVIEVMGRHCGWLALMAGISTGADFIFIPERPPVVGKWESEMLGVIEKGRKTGKRKTIVIVAEGAIDSNLDPITPQYLRDLLSKRLGLDTRITTLGHTQRGGVPCAFDRMLATIQGVEAVKAVLESTPETPSPMIGIRENKITRTPLVEAVRLTHEVAAAIKRKDFRRAMELRDPEFHEYYEAYQSTTIADSSFDITLPKEQRLRIALIHIGAPAGGMNAATRAAVRYCINRGHTPVAILNGFPGLIRHDAAREFNWMSVHGFTTRGGSEIGTNRFLPSIDMGMAAWMFQKHRFEALMIIGGFEAFAALCEMRKARDNYPAFRIPMVCLPATISNNVPGTDFSLGSDTCLNSLIDYCDTIKQSASASRRRVFVVETQGGRCGYVAVLAALCISAIAVYTPEEGITLSQLQSDIDHLKRSFALDRGENRMGKIFLRNEKASEKAYTTEIITNIIREEAKGRFEARTAVPGHVQQGGYPSPMDRVRATRLGVKCIQWLENPETRKDCTSAVIGIRGSGVVFTDSHKLETQETDFEARRPKTSWWSDLKSLGNILSGRDIPDIVEASEKERIEAMEARMAEEAKQKEHVRV